MSEQLFEVGRRTFDTPAFRGIEFIEVEAKSILNKVPGDYLPFNWTINPYRGCSHACTYCLAGDTPVLMADGRQKPLADVRVGDEIYGTERFGNYRRYVKTEVLAHWQMMKRAYRTALADGTELISSGDHRFLTDRGWKHVTGSEEGPVLRARLGAGDLLLGLKEGGTGEPGGSIEGDEVRAGRAMSVVSVEPLGVEMPMLDITTGTGDFIADGVVSHNCFARVTHTYMDMSAGRDFESKIVVKVNAPELLRKELRAKRWLGESVAMGTATDPYQRAEGRYRITQRIVETLLEVRNSFSILTKGTLILRDLDLLQEAASVTEVSTAFSIGTLDEDVWRRSEPGTPHPRKRVEAVRKLNDAGIPCNVLIAPVLPGISDSPEQLREVVAACLDAGARKVSPIMLHLRPGVKEVYMEWLGNEFPELVSRYEEMYRTAYGRRSDRTGFSELIQPIIREERGKRPRPKLITTGRSGGNGHRNAELARKHRAELGSEQLTLI